MKTRVAVLGTSTLLAVAGWCGLAQADETHTDSHNAPVVALISTGQIDDPLEDVLEHAAVFGTTAVHD